MRWPLALWLVREGRERDRRWIFLDWKIGAEAPKHHPAARGREGPGRYSKGSGVKKVCLV
jgi:hypothetical protein